jgi:hypothetical protein
MNKLVYLFLTAYLQVLFVAGNTFFIAQTAWIGVAVCSFAISYLWTLNVKKISVGQTTERIVYATGAMCGGLSGVGLGILITNLI